MKRFMCWWSGDYCRTLEHHQFSWFSEDRGYSSEYIHQLAELDLGQTIMIDAGDHIITRVE